MATVPLILTYGDDSVEIIHVPMEPELPVQSNAFSAPALAQQGRPVEIAGPFDGNLSNTSATCGAREATVLAESPRKLIVDAPDDMVGPAPLAIDEGDSHVEGSLNVVSLNLSTSDPTLVNRQKALVTAEVGGLQNLPPAAFPIELVMMNLTSSVIAMDKAGSTTLVQNVDQKAVDENGFYRTGFTVQGIDPGAYGIAGSVNLTNAVSVPLR